MKAAVLGSGLMGSVVAWDLARSKDVDGVVVSDIDPARLSLVKKMSGNRKLSTQVLDISNRTKTEKFLADFDVAISALPHGVVHLSDLAAVASGTKMVNIAFEDEQMQLDSEARRTGAMLIPGCGLAPGLGGILLTHALEEIGGGDEGHILVGGLPQNPTPPFGYRLVFSIVGLIREYVEDARIIRDGKTVKVRPFSEIEVVDFPKPIGRLEAFCTDGLASLLYTTKEMRILDEKTLRWPGHAEIMKSLEDAGYFSKETVKVGRTDISPLQMSWEVLGKKLREGDPHDMTVMRVIARSKKSEYVYNMVDRYDDTNGVTSMGKTTGYTASIVAQMVGSGRIRGRGTIAPEKAVSGKLVDNLLAELQNRGVMINWSRNPSISR